MRIFYAVTNSPNAAFDSLLWRRNLYDSLVELGHEVIEFDYDLSETFQHLDKHNLIDKKFISTNRPKISQALAEQIEMHHRTKPIDLFFSYFYDACILPQTVDSIKEMEIQTVNFYCNGSYQLHLVEEIAPHYDHCLVPEKFRLKDYMAMGANPIYCQEAANPQVYHPYPEDYLYDVTFVGQAYGDRPEFIKHIHDSDIEMKVWGMNWDNYSAMPKPQSSQKSNKGQQLLQSAYSLTQPSKWKKILPKLKSAFQSSQQIQLPHEIVGGVLSDRDMVRLYSQSRINLGFSSVGNTHTSSNRILQVRLRDFEVPMSGGFYLVEYMEELEEFFEIGKEIVCYNDKEDLVDKIKYYLKHENEREQIRKAGYERCRKNHTWVKRLTLAFEEMGLS